MNKKLTLSISIVLGAFFILTGVSFNKVFIQRAVGGGICQDGTLVQICAHGACGNHGGLVGCTANNERTNTNTNTENKSETKQKTTCPIGSTFNPKTQQCTICESEFSKTAPQTTQAKGIWNPKNSGCCARIENKNKNKFVLGNIVIRRSTNGPWQEFCGVPPRQKWNLVDACPYEKIRGAWVSSS